MLPSMPQAAALEPRPCVFPKAKAPPCIRAGAEPGCGGPVTMPMQVSLWRPGLTRPPRLIRAHGEPSAWHIARVLYKAHLPFRSEGTGVRALAMRCIPPRSYAKPHGPPGFWLLEPSGHICPEVACGGLPPVPYSLWLHSHYSPLGHGSARVRGGLGLH